MRPTLALISGLLFAGSLAANPGYVIQDILTADSPSASRSPTWKPGAGIPLEVGGMDFTADGRLAVAIRKGEVWLLDGVLGPRPDQAQHTKPKTPSAQSQGNEDALDTRSRGAAHRRRPDL